MRRSDLALMLLMVAAFVAASLPWRSGDPDGMMVWSFAVAPPVLLGRLLSWRERRVVVA